MTRPILSVKWIKGHAYLYEQTYVGPLSAGRPKYEWRYLGRIDDGRAKGATTQGQLRRLAFTVAVPKRRAS